MSKLIDVRLGIVKGHIANLDDLETFIIKKSKESSESQMISNWYIENPEFNKDKTLITYEIKMWDDYSLKHLFDVRIFKSGVCLTFKVICLTEKDMITDDGTLKAIGFLFNCVEEYLKEINAEN